jgi:hypothetical protein
MSAVTTAPGTWNVLEHGPIEKLEPNLWRVEGDLPSMSMRRVMTLVRMRDGRLVIHSAIALEDELMREIEAFGTPTFLVVPSGYHRMDAPAFKARYPDLRVVCPAAAREPVEKAVPVDLTYDGFPEDPDVVLRHVSGVGEREGVMLVRHEGGCTLVFNDLIFNMPHQGGFRGFVYKHLTQSSGGPRISRLARMFIIRDRAALAADLRALSETPDIRRIIVAHHEIIDGDPAAVLRGLAE